LQGRPASAISRDMTGKTKAWRPKPRTPRGFGDRFGVEIAREREMLARISAVYESYGFDPLETPAFEYTDALGKFLPDVDRPNQGVFSLQDDDEQWMSLRYDLTAPLARYVAENYDALPKPFRRYAVGTVWRNEKPGPGRFRQFTQCDADTVGAPAPHADVECVVMLATALEAAGLARGEFLIRLNDRNALTGLLETLGLADGAHAAKRLGVLRAMDKLDRLGDAGVAALLGPGRKDQSGDYTDGAGLADADIARVMAFMRATAATNAETCARLADVVGSAAPGAKGVETLASMAAQLKALGLDEGRAMIDLSVIRGLEYYTGPVFEAEVTREIMSDGRPVRLGSVASGGRYDGLVERFKGIEVPAVGISVGVSRLLSVLAFTSADARAEPGPVVILALEDDQMADYQQMAAELRASGVRAEVYVGGSGMKAQLKYADKRNAPLAVMVGGDERARGEVTIKDLVRGSELSLSIDTNAAWRESKPAQFSVSRAEFVAAVARMMVEKK